MIELDSSKTVFSDKCKNIRYTVRSWSTRSIYKRYSLIIRPLRHGPRAHRTHSHVFHQRLNVNAQKCCHRPRAFSSITRPVSNSKTRIYRRLLWSVVYFTPAMVLLTSTYDDGHRVPVFKLTHLRLALSMLHLVYQHRNLTVQMDL